MVSRESPCERLLDWRIWSGRKTSEKQLWLFNAMKYIWIKLLRKYFCRRRFVFVTGLNWVRNAEDCERSFSIGMLLKGLKGHLYLKSPLFVNVFRLKKPVPFKSILCMFILKCALTVRFGASRFVWKQNWEKTSFKPETEKVLKIEKEYYLHRKPLF